MGCSLCDRNLKIGEKVRFGFNLKESYCWQSGAWGETNIQAVIGIYEGLIDGYHQFQNIDFVCPVCRELHTSFKFSCTNGILVDMREVFLSAAKREDESFD